MECCWKHNRTSCNPLSGNPLWGEDRDGVRRLWWLDPSVAHLNHGGCGTVPVEVHERQ
jgi:hypothetical protein